MDFCSLFEDGGLELGYSAGELWEAVDVDGGELDGSTVREY